MILINDIGKIEIPKRSIAIYWLGQAGFAIKMPGGKIIIIDAYLSDCCERIHGFKRIVPSVIEPEELIANLIISTHAHYDHFDLDSISILANRPGVKIAGPKSVMEKSNEVGIDNNKFILLEEGNVIDFEEFKLLPVYADHGNLAPDALGIILDFDNFKLYYTGDTSYRPEKMQAAILSKPEIIILPINGRFGNLNPIEAAKLVKDTGAKVSIPCHFWTFTEHGGEPILFKEALDKYSIRSECKFLRIGEGFIYS